MSRDAFSYSDERFADLQMLRYRLKGFESLTLEQKKLIYCLSEATIYGRDITFDQFGRYNLRIRRLLEIIYTTFKGDRNCDNFKALEVYLKRVWFSNGIYHHYGCEKFTPGFDDKYLRSLINDSDMSLMPLSDGETIEDLCSELFPVIFDPSVLPMRVTRDKGVDIIQNSACNFYEGVTRAEVDKFYNDMKKGGGDHQPSYGLNTKLVKENGMLKELAWKEDGLYGEAIKKIIFWLEKAKQYAESETQKEVIELLIKYYKTGDVADFDEYSIKWVGSHEGMVDFINGFIEVYGDPAAIKGTWEGIVEYKDMEATRRTRTISENAQWFEDHSPVDKRFKKEKVKGVTANVICAAMLGGDEYPSTAIGINLPNADWIRAEHGSKSVTIGNLTEAYSLAAKGNGFRDEFVVDRQTIDLINTYGDVCDDLHTDLHECLGHGSGRLLPGVDPNAIGEYGNTIEEARADLFGLYYIADEKLVELGLVPNGEAYKSQYYTYIMNGLMTQLTRIKPGRGLEEAHMQNRALIANYCYEKGSSEGVMQLVKREGKTYLVINDYEALRALFAELLAEIQRIKSTGDYDAARDMVEKYGKYIDRQLHEEIYERYRRLDLAPYKGFINPRLNVVRGADGSVTDIVPDYTEGYAEQMLRYSRDYATLI